MDYVQQDDVGGGWIDTVVDNVQPEDVGGRVDRYGGRLCSTG